MDGYFYATTATSEALATFSAPISVDGPSSWCVSRTARLAYLNACGHRGALLITHRVGNNRASCARITDSASTPTAAAPRCRWRGADGPKRLRRFDVRSDADRAARQLSWICIWQPVGDVPDLRDHLGPATALIDIFVAPAPQELEIVTGLSVYRDCVQLEDLGENGPDAYRAPVVHNNFAAAINFREQRRSAPGSTGPTRAGSVVARVRRATISVTATPHSGTSAAIRRHFRSTRTRTC